jgi:hypothetical protein
MAHRGGLSPARLDVCGLGDSLDIWLAEIAKDVPRLASPRTQDGIDQCLTLALFVD